jgi:hypothetical protein
MLTDEGDKVSKSAGNWNSLGKFPQEVYTGSLLLLES